MGDRQRMIRKIAKIPASLLLCAASYAATISTTMTVQGVVNVSSTGTTLLSGTATLTNVGNGAITATLSAGASGFTGSFSIAFTAGGTLTGTLTAPASVLSGSGNVSATVTGGTGTYAGATGSFPTMPGQGGFTTTGQITLNFSGPGTITTSGGGSTGPTGPTISDVLDAASNTENVAPGSIFIVKGSNLCPSGFTSFNVPRPTTAPDGVKITFTPTAGGTGTDALLWYEYNQSGTVQLAAILPSTVTAGKYNVTVTNGTASSPFVATVVTSKFEMFTQDSSGTGLASVQNYISASQVDLNSFTTGTGKSTTISPAHPGQYLLAYGTGIGAVSGDDNIAAPAYDFTQHGFNVQVIVGGMSIPAAYAGRAGYAGEDQVNVQLPGNVPTGCAVSFQVSVNGVLSVPTFIAIAPANAAACVAQGYTTAQLQSLDAGTVLNSGGFDVSQTATSAAGLGTLATNSAGGSFTQYTAYQPPFFSFNSSTISVQTIGSCVVTHASASTGTIIGGNGIGLDAGTVTLAGPAASNIGTQTFTQDAKSKGYTLTLATTGAPAGFGGGTGTITAGQYTVSGAGGKDVGKFSTSLTLGTPLTVTGGLPSTITRANGLPLSWSGGNPADTVTISGGSSNSTDSWSFVCTTTAGAGGFTVSSQVLNLLPTSSSGFIGVLDTPTPASFTAPLTAGGSISGQFSALLTTGGQATYQ